eukprot:6095201-Amphidinium_carterae.1
MGMHARSGHFGPSATEVLQWLALDELHASCVTLVRPGAVPCSWHCRTAQVIVPHWHPPHAMPAALPFHAAVLATMAVALHCALPCVQFWWSPCFGRECERLGVSSGLTGVRVFPVQEFLS